MRPRRLSDGAHPSPRSSSVRATVLPLPSSSRPAARHSGSRSAQDPPAALLWYDKAATAFEEALPLGNGRTGAMVFGGPASDRFLLNDSTLWTGGPIDPAVNPDAVNWLPQRARGPVQGRLQDRRRADAEDPGEVLAVVRAARRPVHRRRPASTSNRSQATAANWISRPPSRARRSPREATRSLARRSSRIPDKLLVIRLSASAPGAPGLRAAIHEPAPARGDRRRQRRSAALRPRARPRRTELPQGHQGPVRLRRGAEPQGHAVRGARADPAARTAASAAAPDVDDDRGRDHGAPRGRHRHEFRRVRQGTGRRARTRSGRRWRGSTPPPAAPSRACWPRTRRTSARCSRACRSRPRPYAAGREADRRPPARVRGGRGRPGPRGPLLPVRPLPAHQRLEARQPGAEPAGHLEPAHAAAVEQQLHGQHQHRDELLAGRDDQPGRVPSAAAALHRRPGEDRRRDGPPLLRRGRLVRPSQQRHLGAQQPGRRLRPGRPQVGQLADGGRLDEPAPLGALRLRRRRGVAARRRRIRS